MAPTVWEIAQHLKEERWSEINDFTILILNRPINVAGELIINLWNEAKYTATADGGTDRWYNFVSTASIGEKLRNINPALTAGDFDSIRPETLEACKKAGVRVVHTPDQDFTDFEKTLKEIIKDSDGLMKNVIAVVECSGRLDHTMSNLNTLYKMASSSTRLYLLSKDDLTWVLPEGSHEILVPHSLVQRQTSCGLIPLGKPCTITSSGLKWNLDNTKLEFGGLISTSNTYDNKNSSPDSTFVVSIQTDAPIIWTMTLHEEN